MKVILNNVDTKHTEILQKLAQTLNFNIEDVQFSELEEEKALYKAIEEGKSTGRMSSSEQKDFEKWLDNL